MEVEPDLIPLSIQRALLGAITPSLRMVCYTTEDFTITLYLYYDQPITEFEEELAGDVSAEVIADFPQEYLIELKLERISFPQKICAPGQTVYRRFEQ